MSSLALVALAVVVVQWIAFVPAWLARTERWYDVVGAATWLLAVGMTLAMADSIGARAWLLAALVGSWSLRLGVFLARRIARDGGDGRFEAIKQSAPRFLLAWTLQGVWIILTGLGAALAMSVEPSPLSWLDAAGAAVWALGFGLEVLADAQKRRHRAAHPGRFIESGLWAWSRHPNYFGEILLWCGVAMVAAAGLDELRWAALVSPVFVAILLTWGSGVPLLERRAEERWGQEPAYRAYVARTPVLIPRPPARA